MAYVKNIWVNQQGQIRYTETEDEGYKIFTANYEEVTEIGTPVNADNMNHIEDGIADNDTAITIINSKIPSNATSLNKMVTQLDLDGKADVDLSNTNPSQSFINSVKNWINYAPDYSRATTVSIASGGTIDWDGWLAIQMFYNGSLDTYARINGVTIAYSSRSSEGGGAGTTAAGISMVSNGDILTHNAGSYTIWKIPFKS